MLKKLLFLFVFMLSYTLFSQTIFVDQNATGLNNGTDWANAYTNLQTAITNIGTNTTINVAQGTYYPTATTDRTISFNIPRDKKLFGGFPTGGGTRNPELYETILSGDIGTQGVDTDNSYHVVYFLNTNPDTEMDGFIIEKGYADGSGTYEYVGGGIFINTIDTRYYGVYIRNCTVRNNYARDGGGISAGKQFKIYNCKIYSNQADENGGGLTISTSGNIYNSYIVNNSAGSYGGGIYLGGSIGDPKAINCVITNNESLDGAGAYVSLGTLINCVVTNNKGNYGAYLFNGGAKNSIIWGNEITISQVRVPTSFADTYLQNNLVQDLTPFGTNISLSGENNGAIIGENYPRFTNPTTFKGNTTTPAQLNEILNANWNINPESVAINFGDNSLYPTDVDTPIIDIIGNNRTINITIDAGAHEALTNVFTNATTNQQPTLVTLNGEVIFAETTNTITRGFVYAITPNFDVTTATSVTNAATGLGIYSDNITGLTQDQLYYYRTWVAFDGVKYYGSEKQFKASNLVAYYPFNGNANDESGNENNGTVNGATLTTDRFGNTNSAYYFDGASNYISITDNPNVNVQTGESYTISYWTKHNAQNDGKYMISKYMGSIGVEPSYGLGTGSDGDSYSWFEFTAGNGIENRGSIDLNDTDWHNITTVFKSGESVSIYIDGVLDVSESTTYTGSIINSNNLIIGCNGNFTRFYNGSIDDIKIYNKAFTSSEVSTLYNNETLAVSTEIIEANNFYVNNNTLYFKNTQNLTELKNVEVYNLLGQKVFETSKIEKEIPITNLPKGIYILKVEDKNSIYNTLKFLSY